MCLKFMLGFISAAMVIYLALTLKIAYILLVSHHSTQVLLGIGVFVMALVGVWALYATLRESYIYQRLSRSIGQQGGELDITGFARRPSGRLEPHAAEELFYQVQAEADARPDAWQSWYRLGRAYEYAGDSPRARKALRRAAELYAKNPVEISPEA